MRVQFSDPILVADATAVDFDLLGNPSKVKVGVVFYDTAEAATGDEIAAGTGSRNLAITQTLGESAGQAVSFAFAGGTLDSPTATGGNVSGLPARTLVTFDTGVGVGRLRVSSAADVNATGGVSYRIVMVS